MDELSRPLGREPPRPPSRRWVRKAIVGAAVLFGTALGGFALWTLVADDPLGGEPQAVVAIGGKADAAKSTEAAASGQTPAQTPAPASPPAAASVPAPAGQTVTIIDGVSGKRTEVRVPGSGPDASSPQASPPPAAAPPPQDKAPANEPVREKRSEKPSGGDKRLLEESRHGPLPRIGADGSRPADVYAGIAVGPSGRPAGPHIAIVVGRLGIGTSRTEDAIGKLPAPVTLGFLPYGEGLNRAVAEARGQGHEVLLQVPMEPFEYPDNDPGPQTLLTSLPADQDIDRLHWAMSRIQGYVGIGNYMGARFTANEAAVTAMLREVGKRGLAYFDDGSSSRSITAQAAVANSVPFGKADLVIDAAPTIADIDAALMRLEAIARERGQAVGFASALPIAIDRIARWAPTLAARGISLVPITAVTSRAKSS